MESKRLAHHNTATRTIRADEETIEVPVGSHSFFIEQKAGMQHHTFHLRFPGTEVHIMGRVEAKGEEKFELETAVVHHAPNTKAETLIKTLAKDKAEPRYRGMIRIEPGSFGCESYLNHHSLLIGERAQSWTTPSLEILNNDVRCSHAATVRTLTPLDLFYLESRGLPANEAKAVLIEAFLSDVQI